MLKVQYVGPRVKISNHGVTYRKSKEVIKHRDIKEITIPFNKSFFHVLNSIRGALIAAKSSLDARVIEENNNVIR